MHEEDASDYADYQNNGLALDGISELESVLRGCLKLPLHATVNIHCRLCIMDNVNIHHS